MPLKYDINGLLDRSHIPEETIDEAARGLARTHEAHEDAVERLKSAQAELEKAKFAEMEERNRLDTAKALLLFIAARTQQ